MTTGTFSRFVRVACLRGSARVSALSMLTDDSIPSQLQVSTFVRVGPFYPIRALRRRVCMMRSMTA
jgi:hypothetical protein